MNGAQDVGGMMGFGPVAPERDEPLFHAEWEKRALGVVLACGALGLWNLDSSRRARESLHPVQYWSKSYYDIWVTALEHVLARHNLASAAELADPAGIAAALPAPRILRADAVAGFLARGSAFDRPAPAPARFKAGDAVATRNINPVGHTRLPRYARSKRGVIEAVRGCFVFPDSNAHGGGEASQWCYTLLFSGRELWGQDADPMLGVSIDAFEAYLEPA